jgi:exosortase
LFWKNKDVLKSIPPAPSWIGFPIILFALGVLIAGSYGAELFLSRISLLFLLAGVILTFRGWNQFRVLAFPLLTLLLAIPIPAIIFNQITFPLQLLASRIASDILPFLNVPVLREGNVIYLPAMPLEVAEACSGIRSLMSLGTLAIFYGYFLENSITRRVILALFSIPIAVAANALRIVGTGICVLYWDPDTALGFFHEFSGWVMFMVSLALLYGIHLVMRLFKKKEKPAA